MAGDGRGEVGEVVVAVAEQGMASWPTWRPARLACSPARAAASRTRAGSPVCSTMVAHDTTLVASSRETYMSAARKVSAWKVLSVTPNCLRLVR